MTGNKILRRFKNAHFKPSCCWRFIGIPVGDNWNSVEFLMDFLLTKNTDALGIETYKLFIEEPPEAKS